MRPMDTGVSNWAAMEKRANMKLHFGKLLARMLTVTEPHLFSNRRPTVSAVNF